MFQEKEETQCLFQEKKGCSFVSEEKRRPGFVSQEEEPGVVQQGEEPGFVYLFQEGQEEKKTRCSSVQEGRTGVVLFNQKKNQVLFKKTRNQEEGQKKNQVLFKKRRPRC